MLSSQTPVFKDFFTSAYTMFFLKDKWTHWYSGIGMNGLSSGTLHQKVSSPFSSYRRLTQILQLPGGFFHPDMF